MHDSGLPGNDAHWLESFLEWRGRRPRVLHIGNIANNAYLNAKLLNARGLDCDVLCYDYYHLMSHPEWERSDYDGALEDDDYPAWDQVDLRGFERPRWFAQGPADLALRYLYARRAGTPHAAARAWTDLTEGRQHFCACMRAQRVQAACPPRAVRLKPHLAPPDPTMQATEFAQRVQAVLARYARCCPEASPPSATDVAWYFGAPGLCAAVLACYDLVIGYSVDGIFPLTLGNCPYVAFEHGTIRSLPFESSALGRICAMVYRLADKVIITNADNNQAAARLGLANYCFVPHPLSEDRPTTDETAALRARLRGQLRADFLVFHASRQHWEAQRHPSWEKGNDVFIHGLARFIKACPNAGAVFVDWGQTVAASRSLLQELGIADRVLWIPPQPNPRLISYIRAADLFADQFYLGAFGNLTPKALMLGRPTLLYLNEDAHRWCFTEMPPVLNVRTPDDVFSQLLRMYASPYRRGQLAEQGIDWYHRHHDNQLVANRLIDVLRELLPVPCPGRVDPALHTAPISIA